MPAVDLPTLSDTELIEQMRDARRRAAMATASEVMAVAELARRREAEARAGGASPVQAGEFVADEVSLALTVTGCAAADLVRIGRMLRERLATTRTAFEAGLIDLPRVKVIVAALIGVAIPVAHQVERAIVELAPALTTGQLRHRIHRALIQADPAAARQRTRTALTHRRIESFDNPDGTADLVGRSLPSDRVAAIRDRLTRTAQALRANGDARPLQAIRADLAMNWLQGTTATPTGTAAPTGIPTSLVETAATPAGNTSEPAAMAQTTAQPGQATSSTAAHGPRATTAPAANTTVGPAMSRAVPPEGVDQTPPHELWASTTSPARRGIAPSTTGGHTSETAAQRAREDERLAVEQAIGNAIAHTADRALRRLLADAAPGGLGTLLHKAITHIEHAVGSLRTHWCRAADPGAHENGRYRPTVRTRRQVETRHPRCAFPTCDKRADGCDLDHTTPWHENGPTCICNLAPLCRHHHRLKQHPQWRLIQPWPGVTIWTTPAATFHVGGYREGRPGVAAINDAPITRQIHATADRGWLGDGC